jgi:hypothetical protein
MAEPVIEVTEWVRRDGELLMTFPFPIRKLKKVGGKLFAEMENGQTIDLTKFLGEARQ